MKAVRVLAFVAALGLFIGQVALARSAGQSPLEILGVVLVTFAVLAAIVAVLVLAARHRQRRRVRDLRGARSGWVGVHSILALAAGTPAGAPRQAQSCALLFGPQGVELWTGKSAPYRLLFSAPWTQLTVSPAPVSYVPGRAVVKAGLALAPTNRSPLYMMVFPDRAVRAAFPAATRPECVVAAMATAAGWPADRGPAMGTIRGAH